MYSSYCAVSTACPQKFTAHSVSTTPQGLLFDDSYKSIIFGNFSGK